MLLAEELSIKQEGTTTSLATNLKILGVFLTLTQDNKLVKPFVIRINRHVLQNSLFILGLCFRKEGNEKTLL